MTPYVISKNMCEQKEVSVVKLSYKSEIQKENRIKITQSKDVVELLRSLFNGELEHVESMWMLSVNRNNEVMAAFMVSQGGVSGTVADPKVIFQAALLTNASGVILSHNHPSGNLAASQSDIQLTKKIMTSCQLLEIQLLDHIILTADGHLSMADEGHI